MIKEHDRVVLKEEVLEQGLKTGDVGTVIHVHKKDKAFEVEFVALDGETLAIATLGGFPGSPGSEKRNHPRTCATCVRSGYVHRKHAAHHRSHCPGVQPTKG